MSIIRVDTQGGGGGGSPLQVQENGVPVVVNTQLINFTTNLIAVATSPNSVDVSAVIPAATIDILQDGVLINPNCDQIDFLSDLQVTPTGATSVSVKPNTIFQNMLFVAKNGNDGTAEVGSINRKFQTITAAIAAVNTNGLQTISCIVVAAGQYTENIVLTGGINIYFNPRAELYGKMTFNNSVALADNGVWGYCNAYGSGNDVLHFVSAVNSYVEVNELRAADNEFVIKKQGSGTSKVVANKIVVNNGAQGFVTQSNGILYIKCPDVSVLNIGAPAPSPFINIRTNSVLFDFDGDDIYADLNGVLMRVSNNADVNAKFNYGVGQIEFADAAGFIKILGAAASGSIVTGAGVPQIYFTATPANTPNVRISNMNLISQVPVVGNFCVGAIIAGATLYLNQYVQSNQTWDTANVTLAGAGTFVVDPTMQVINP